MCLCKHLMDSVWPAHSNTAEQALKMKHNIKPPVIVIQTLQYQQHTRLCPQANRNDGLQSQFASFVLFILIFQLPNRWCSKFVFDVFSLDFLFLNRCSKRGGWRNQVYIHIFIYSIINLDLIWFVLLNWMAAPIAIIYMPHIHFVCLLDSICSDLRLHFQAILMHMHSNGAINI